MRLALGASPSDLERLVLRFGLRIAAAGLVIGVPAAVLFARVLSSLVADARRRIRSRFSRSRPSSGSRW